MELSFPLTSNDLFALKKGGFILSGTTTLASGAATLSDRRIKPSSKALLGYDVAAKALTHPGILSGACSDGELSIASTSATDASDVAYLIIL